ncbi:MAG: hypothetical protein ACRCTZ_07480 [Sarcina sp.]
MGIDIENINNPMYREYIGNIEERDLLREQELEIDDEELAIKNEERVSAMEEFNPINEDILMENNFIQERIVENEALNSFEMESELEEDLDIIQEDKELNW